MADIGHSIKVVGGFGMSDKPGTHDSEIGSPEPEKPFKGPNTDNDGNFTGGFSNYSDSKTQRTVKTTATFSLEYSPQITNSEVWRKYRENYYGTPKLTLGLNPVVGLQTEITTTHENAVGTYPARDTAETTLAPFVGAELRAILNLDATLGIELDLSAIKVYNENLSVRAEAGLILSNGTLLMGLSGLGNDPDSVFPTIGYRTNL